MNLKKKNIKKGGNNNIEKSGLGMLLNDFLVKKVTTVTEKGARMLETVKNSLNPQVGGKKKKKYKKKVVKR